uniref:Uncharacterized protein n=1 Tax=Clytia hemisphaerica TaxID=252671 RepID=A0A7M5X818_9CNID
STVIYCFLLLVEDPLHQVTRKCIRQGRVVNCNFYKKLRKLPCRVTYSGCGRPNCSSCKTTGNQRSCLLRTKCEKVCRERCEHGTKGCKMNVFFVRSLNFILRIK